MIGIYRKAKKAVFPFVWRILTRIRILKKIHIIRLRPYAFLPIRPEKEKSSLPIEIRFLHLVFIRV